MVALRCNEVGTNDSIDDAVDDLAAATRRQDGLAAAGRAWADDRRWPRGARGYVAILLCKRAEQAALARLPREVRERMLPLIEAREAPLGKDGSPKRTFAQQVQWNVESLARGWGIEDEFLLDARTMVPREAGPDGIVATELLYEQAEKRGLRFVPVVGLEQKLRELAPARGHLSRGVCFRVTRRYMNERLVRRLDLLLKRFKFQRPDVDLILDYGTVDDVEPDGQETFLGDVRGVLRSLPHEGWRSLVLAMSSLPPMRGIKGARHVDRLEWWIWKQLRRSEPALQRMPTFADYAIEGARARSNAAPKFMRNAPPTIRYTYRDQLLIVRGTSAKDSPPQRQYPGLARVHLVDTPYFAGRDHCDGCGDAYRCARGRGNERDRTSWRRICAYHHLIYVVEQIRDLRGV